MVEEDLTVHLDRRLQGVEWQTKHTVALLLEQLQVLEEFMRTLVTICSLVKRIEQELLSHRISCKIMTISKKLGEQRHILAHLEWEARKVWLLNKRVRWDNRDLCHHVQT